MRESNFAFPAQNRACVCISSQLYDRRALDTHSPLPLFNSLTHLVYLTSTSPRIREIMTMDGGLERLVRILLDFCISPPPPHNPAIFYGLSPPASHPPIPLPTLLPKSWDKHAAYRFSLAFQSIVNIGVRGSESIRSRVVQAGTLDVVGCILEAWLASKGFPVGPNLAANGMPRESREQRLARRQAQLQSRQREQAAAIARALERQIATDPALRSPDGSVHSIDSSLDEPMQTEHHPTPGASRAHDTDTSADTSTNATPNGGNTPTGAVLVPARDRSGTVVARPVWDQPPANTARRSHHRSRPNLPPASAGPSTSTSAANSRPDTETEDDADVDMDRDSRHRDPPSFPDPERQPSDAGTLRATHSRRAVGIVSDTAGNPGPGPSMDMNSDPHIVINDDGVVTGVGVEDGIVSLEANDDFAMGAPPGAPGAIDGPPARAVPDPHPAAGERTPRAGTANLPMTAARPTIAGAFLAPDVADTPGPRPPQAPTPARVNTIRARNAADAANGPAPAHHHHHHHHHPRETETGPYRDEDVLLSLQLLAYLSKYPHCREAFYTMRPSFHPATLQHANDGRFGQSSSSSGRSTSASTAGSSSKFVKAFNTATGRGKEKAPSSTAPGTAEGAKTRMTNMFALVERFTYRHSSSDLESSHPPPSLPPEIQYWAGVIMRNACRKDDSRGGIRQCANMLCGKWERFPREFAKCRRCRKAKYCGKECQSTAWSEGHRFWCSAKDPEEEDHHHHRQAADEGSREAAAPVADPDAVAASRTERREARDRESEEERLRERVRERSRLERQRHGREQARQPVEEIGTAPAAAPTQWRAEMQATLQGTVDAPPPPTAAQQALPALTAVLEGRWGPNAALPMSRMMGIGMAAHAGGPPAPGAAEEERRGEERAASAGAREDAQDARTGEDVDMMID